MEKLKVMLIDDETLIRKLIRMKINWEALDMEVVAEFSSSRKALESVESIRPDIIITDICMPGMDGIEFSEACIRLLPQVKIVILTGHDEFDYAKRSIHIGVSDYILKPVSGEEITKSLQKISKKLYEEQAKKTEYEEMLSQIEENKSAFCEAYLNQVLLKAQPAEVFCHKMAYYQVAFNPESSQIQVAVLEIEVPFKGLGQEDESDEIILYLKARQLTEEFFSGDSYFLFCRDGIGRIVILSNNPKVPFLECLELLSKMLINKLKCYVNIGLGLVKNDYSYIASSYKEAIEAINYKIVEGNNCVICYDEINKSRGSSSSEEEAIWNESKIYIRAGMKEKAESCIHALWQLYGDNESAENYRARNMCIKIVSWCFNEAVRQELPDKMDFQRKSERIYENKCCIKEYEQNAVECVGSVAKAMAVKDEKKTDSLIHDIILYMNENLSDPELNMNKVAGHAFISTGYLGRTLKKHTGKTYSEYLSELRFNRVKQLLEETDMKGYELGEKIGILDAHYLSIWFKKMSGYSLSDYKKMIKGIKNETPSCKNG